jgi:ELWxxDGT repeat protein
VLRLVVGLTKNKAFYMRKKLLYHTFMSSQNGMRRMMRALVLNFSLIFIFTVSGAQIQLLKDVNQAEDPLANEYRYLIKGSTRFYYVSNNELWSSNGTTAGTQLVKAFKSIDKPVLVGSTLYFGADNGGTGLELWKSDGTPAGTVLVKDIFAGSSGSSPTSFTDVSGTVFFAARSSSNGLELWRTNGTAGGTVMVKDIIKGIGSSNPGYLTNLNGTLLFVANDGQIGYELWKSDGTSTGTFVVKDIRTAAKVSSLPQYLTNVNGTVYFGAIDDIGGRELWKTDGTTAGTARVKDINPGATGSDVENLINVNGTLFFTANDGVHGDELWKSNGTSAGTVLVKDMNPGSGGSNNTFPGEENPPKMDNFTNMNGLLYFTAAKDYNNYIYRSDGTEVGTIAIAPAIWSDYGGSIFIHPYFTYMNGYVYFYNNEMIPSEYEVDTYLFRMPYNGTTPEHVIRVFYDFAYGMINFNNNLYTVAKLYPDKGYQLLRSDGTAAGTSVLIDNSKVTVGSNINQTLTLNGYIFFRAQTQLYSYEDELWRTDGTPEGTIKIGDLYGGSDWEIVGSYLYWIKTTDAGWEIWKTKGTPATTAMVKRNGIPEDGVDFAPRELVNVSGKLYFSTPNGQLWRSDGTTAGTKMLRDFSAIWQLYGTPTRAYLVVTGSTGDRELWKADATGAYKITTLLSNGVEPKIAWYYPSIMIGNVLYFVTQDNTHGNEVWRTDGSMAGTYMVQDLSTRDDLNGTPKEFGVNSFVLHRDTLYVSATDNNQDVWLWKQTGARSFEKVKEIYGSQMLSYNGLLYIFGRDNRDWRDNVLWVTDGTTDGFRLLAEYDGDEQYSDWGIVGNVVYFNAKGGSSLWRTDGTECGTFTVPTAGLAAPWPAEGLGSSLVFAAYTPEIGNEPYVYRNINAQNPSSCSAAMARTASANTSGVQPKVLNAYPNPYIQDFSLRLDGKDGEEAEVSVFTNAGLPVETFKNVKSNTDYEHIGVSWPRGVYIVKINQGGKLSTHMIVKK